MTPGLTQTLQLNQFPIYNLPVIRKPSTAIMKSILIPFSLILPLFLTWAEPKTSNAPFLAPGEAITNMKTPRLRG